MSDSIQQKEDSLEVPKVMLKERSPALEEHYQWAIRHLDRSLPPWARLRTFSTTRMLSTKIWSMKLIFKKNYTEQIMMFKEQVRTFTEHQRRWILWLIDKAYSFLPLLSRLEDFKDSQAHVTWPRPSVIWLRLKGSLNKREESCPCDPTSICAMSTRCSLNYSQEDAESTVMIFLQPLLETYNWQLQRTRYS